MEINWLVVTIVVLCAIALIIYIIRQNIRDRRNLEKKLNNDYKPTYNKESELNNEDR